MFRSKKILLTLISTILLAGSACGPTWIAHGKLYGINVKDGKQGVLHLRNSEVIFPPVYDEVTLMEGETLVKLSQNGFFCLGNTNGEVLLPCEQEDIILVDNSPIVGFKQKGRYGLINYKTQKTLAEDLDNIRLYPEKSFAFVQKNGKFGIISDTALWWARPQYDDITIKTISGESTMFLKKDGKWGLASESHGFILPTEYSAISVYPIVKRIIVTTEDQRQGLANYEGEMLIPPQAAKLERPSSEGTFYKVNDKFGLLLNGGKRVTEPIYESYVSYSLQEGEQSAKSEHYYAVQQDGLWGLIDYRGEVITPPRFKDVPEDWIEAIIVKKRGKYGLYDYDGREIAPAIYDKIDIPTSGRAMAHLGKTSQYLYLSAEHERAWRRGEAEAAAERQRQIAAREARLREEKLTAERDAALALHRERQEIQEDIDNMSARITKLRNELNRLNRIFPDDPDYDDNKRDIHSQIQDLERRIKERERQRRDLALGN